MSTFFSRFHVVIKALAIGLVLLIPAVFINQSIIQSNVSAFPGFPWSFIGVLIVLGLYWQLANGKKYPFGYSEFRERHALCHRPVHSKGLAGWVLTGTALFVFVYAVNAIGFGLYGFEETVQLAFINYIATTPPGTAIFLYLGAALTAGVVEEIVFRGYIQKMIGDHFGAIASFIFVGIVFTITHFLPPPLWLPYFLVSLAFSWVAYITKSVYIGICIHVLFDFGAFLVVYYDLYIASKEFLSGNIVLHILLFVIAVAGLWFMATLNRKNSDTEG